MRISSFLSPVRGLLWALLPLLLVLAGCNNDSDDAAKRLAQLVEEQKVQDDAAIQSYLSTNGIAPGAYERRDSGLYIIWQNRATTGATPASGNQVKVRYIGRYLSTDYRFESSIDNGTACGCTSFTVGTVIEGWNEVLQLMHKGDKVTILVPSHLAYGANGNGLIGPFTPLKFEMELVDFTAQ